MTDTSRRGIFSEDRVTTLQKRTLKLTFVTREFNKQKSKFLYDPEHQIQISLIENWQPLIFFNMGQEYVSLGYYKCTTVEQCFVIHLLRKPQFRYSIWFFSEFWLSPHFSICID